MSGGWHYLVPGQHPAGPVSDDDVRRLYRERQIDLGTLVRADPDGPWRRLGEVAGDLDLDFIGVDPSRPPPLPPRSATSPQAAVPSRRATSPSQLQGRDRGDFSGCRASLAIWALVAVPVAIVGLAVLLPPLQDRALRGQVDGVLVRARPLQATVAALLTTTGRCPGTDRYAVRAGLQQVAEHPMVRAVAYGRRGRDDACVLEVTLRSARVRANGATLQLTATKQGPRVVWDCQGGTLRASLRPARCRPAE